MSAELDVTIRYGTAADDMMLAEMGARTFYDAFADDNSSENMAAFLRATFSPAIQATELSDPSTTFLIVESAGVPVGYALLRESEPAPGIEGAHPLELGRIYVESAWIGYGIGGTLMQACLREAADAGFDTLWLGVWEQNPRAIAFYRHWGFREVGRHIFQLGDDPQTDLLMQRVIAT